MSFNIYCRVLFMFFALLSSLMYIWTEMYLCDASFCDGFLLVHLQDLLLSNLYFSRDLSVRRCLMQWPNPRAIDRFSQTWIGIVYLIM